jgi:hypothetical protein
VFVDPFVAPGLEGKTRPTVYGRQDLAYGLRTQDPGLQRRDPATVYG